MYKIIFTKSAAKELKKLSNQLIARIVPEIQALATEPRPTNCKKLKGEENRYRTRVGDYRILYSIEDTIKIVEIVKIGHRKEVYNS